ncbi:MAG: cysteine desulfurase [Elusimicrobia bacterium]|nr:cysteine desulfurase [Elusimicrobiota bacterium]
MKRIYLDYNATTPIHPLAAKEMEQYIYKYFGNPSSHHWFGLKAKKGVAQARGQIASLLGCLPEEIIFTSGGTESNNYVLHGVAETYREKGNHIITSAIEHPAVLKPCQYLEKQGFEVTYLPVDKYGLINLPDLKSALKPTTILITLMHANNEIGTIQPIAEISKIAKKKNILVHTDAAQSVGKIPTKVKELGVDFLSIAGHKLYAPKGVGALYIRKGINIQPLFLGAGHENGRRAGTENVIAIAGLGKASQILEKTMEKNTRRIQELRDQLHHDLLNIGAKVKLNGHPTQRLPNTLNMSFIGLDSPILLQKMPDIAVSTGSACHATSKEPSGVLKAIGLTNKEAFSAIRFSLGMWTTKQEIDLVAKKIKKIMP